MTAQQEEAIVSALREAATAAELADPGEHADGGTCNLDTPAFTIRGAREKTILALASRAGVGVTPFKWFGRRTWYWVNVPLNGQAMRRERMMEAAQKVLSAVDTMLVPGWVACGYRQCD